MAFIRDSADGITHDLVSHSGRRSFLAAALSILIMALALRTYHIGTRTLWFDEAVLANLAGDSLHEMFSHTRYEHSAPILHPAILYAIEKVNDRPTAVRLPSLAASLLAITVLLATASRVGPVAALLAALLLTVSASQIRYAQEVREYSLSVLWAAVLLYSFLVYTSPQEDLDTKQRWRSALYFALFGAPLIQYGLALLGAAILVSMTVLLCLDRRTRDRLPDIVGSSACLGVGALISVFLTLRYQWHFTHQFKASLSDAYLDSMKGLPAHTMNLLAFILPVRPSSLAMFCAIAAILVCIARTFYLHKGRPLIVLTFSGFAVVATCARLHVYPYYGVRQCLFLAPLVTLLLGVALSDLISLLPVTARKLAIGGAVCGILLSGMSQIRNINPYAEVEDIQSVLKVLENSIQPHDRCYVYYGSVPAVNYYWKHRAPPFVYESSRWGDAEWYVRQILTLGPDTSRVWLVFSSVFGHEEEFIVGEIRPDWNVERTVSVHGASLYLAKRPEYSNALPSRPRKDVSR